MLRVPGYSPEAVAEHAMALAQAANRRICKAYIKVRNNNFALDGLLGYNLYGSSAGIVGTGRIGAAMARICHGFGMTVLAYDQYRNPALDGIVRYVELDELLRTADLISLHCPLTAETYHMINADTIKMMRDNAILVNTSRGGLIDTNALIDALRGPANLRAVGRGRLRGRGRAGVRGLLGRRLQNEVVPILMSFPNVVVTSHQAFFHADGITEHCHHDDGECAGVCKRGEAGERGEGVRKAEGQSCRNPSGVEDKAAVGARCGGGVKTPPYEGRIQWRQS